MTINLIIKEIKSMTRKCFRQITKQKREEPAFKGPITEKTKKEAKAQLCNVEKA